MSNIKRMIRRVDVTEVLYKMLTVSKDESEKECIARIWEQIKGIPVEDIVPVVHGHWIKDGKRMVYQCSVCQTGLQDIGYGYNFCPECGAKMDQEDNHD